MEKDEIRKTIEKLLVVQEKDRRIARCAKELNDMPAMRKELESAVSGRSDDLEKAKADLKALRAAMHTREMEIECERQNIRKLRDQQVQVKTNNEYKALNTQIAHVEKKIIEMEDSEIKLMEQADQLESKAGEIQGALAGEQARFKLEMTQLEQRRATLDSDLAQLKSERATLASDIDGEWLKRYNILMENKKDAVLVAMDKGGTCGGCHMHLSPQVLHNVRGESSMVSCSYCGRMLYWAG